MSNPTENFLYPILTKAHGPLDYKILKVLENYESLETSFLFDTLKEGKFYNTR